MDTRKAKQEVQNARDVLATKGAPIEGTAAGHLILAFEALIADLDNSFGYVKPVKRAEPFGFEADE